MFRGDISFKLSKMIEEFRRETGNNLIRIQGVAAGRYEERCFFATHQGFNDLKEMRNKGRLQT